MPLPHYSYRCWSAFPPVLRAILSVIFGLFILLNASPYLLGMQDGTLAILLTITILLLWGLMKNGVSQL